MSREGFGVADEGDRDTDDELRVGVEPPVIDEAGDDRKVDGKLRRDGFGFDVDADDTPFVGGGGVRGGPSRAAASFLFLMVGFYVIGNTTWQISHRSSQV
jgi:hypothetical protein